MKKQTLNYWSTIQLHRIIVTGGILIILFLSMKFSQAQIDTLQFEFEGLDRDYIVFLPQNYQPNMPVVFNLHGYTYDAQMQMNYSQMNEVADTAGFIVVLIMESFILGAIVITGFGRNNYIKIPKGVKELNS